MSLVRKCIKLVDNNFFFKDGEREKWDINKKKLISEIKAVKSQEETLSIIDKYLIDLKDPHTKLFFKERPLQILPYNFIFIHKKLYLECEKGLKQVIFINQECVQTIFDRYLEIYKSYPLVLIENELIKDIQFMKRSFSKSGLQISYDTGEKKILYPIETEIWMRNLKNQSSDYQMRSVSVRRVDEDCVCIQIVTFRDKNVISQIMDGLAEIQGGYTTVIFDVRNNMGGYIEVAKELVSKIIDSKVRMNYEIARMDGRLLKTMPMDIQENTYEGFKNKRILVFVNYRTMSSAEYIFAHALQLKGISIIGEETAGLKDQAAIIPISDEVSLQVTTKRYVQNGDFIQKGIIPDVFIRNENIDVNVQDAYMEWYMENKKSVVIG